MEEKILEIRKCKSCGSRFEITNKDLGFYEKVSPIFNLETGLGKERPASDNELIKDLGNGKARYLIPTPTLCPDCRQQNRLAWKNDRSIYKSVCNSTRKNIVSVYSPDKKVVVYEHNYWDSDKWNPLDYGINFDFSKTFFEQFKKLFDKVPKPNIFIDNSSINCDFSACFGCKDCYLLFSCTSSENCYFGNRVNYSKKCLDGLLLKDCENCYESIESFSCNKCFFSRKINNCSNCIFCFDCQGLENCFMCVNLKNKKYCIKNVEYSKEEYYKIISQINLGDYERLKEYKIDFDNFLKTNFFKYANITNSHNSTGDNIKNTKNCNNVFDGTNLEDISYSYFIDDSKDCMDINYGCDNTVLNYFTVTTGINAYNILFSIDTWPEVSDLIYCYNCNNGVHHCFGSCCLHSGESYCILNKQYTKEEYNKLVPKIIEHMQKNGERGEFFPSSLSPFGYNETVAQEYFPIEIKTGLSKKDIKYIDREGNTYKDLKEVGERPVFKYSTYESPKPKVEKIIPASKLPEDISDIPDDILNWAIECEVTKKPFRIIREELEFYRKHNLPIPRRHPDRRHLDRMKLKNPRKLYDRKCDKCSKEIKTTYSPDRPEIVYCEECYNRGVY